MKKCNRGKQTFNSINTTAYLLTSVCLCTIVVLFSCSSKDSRSKTNIPSLHEYVEPTKDILEKYRTQTPFTDPGEYVYLISELPDSYKDICTVIKKQLIHPMEAAEMPNTFPNDMLPEDGTFPTVSDMLEELNIRDPEGLTMKRQTKDRLLVACYHHALFLASILRHQGRSVRLRAGFARYYEEQTKVRFSHVVCEVWNAETGQWDIIDPDRNFQKVARDKFEYPSDVWQNYMSNDMPRIKYIGSIGRSENVYIHSLLLDMSFVLCNERSYWHTPEFILRKDFDIRSIEEAQLDVLNKIADLMTDPDKNYSQLEKLYSENSFIQSNERTIHEYYNLN